MPAQTWITVDELSHVLGPNDRFEVMEGGAAACNCCGQMTEVFTRHYGMSFCGICWRAALRERAAGAGKGEG